MKVVVVLIPYLYIMKLNVPLAVFLTYLCRVAHLNGVSLNFLIYLRNRQPAKLRHHLARSIAHLCLVSDNRFLFSIPDRRPPLVGHRITGKNGECLACLKLPDLMLLRL